jgi:hypothetical protein
MVRACRHSTIVGGGGLTPRSIGEGATLPHTSRPFAARHWHSFCSAIGYERRLARFEPPISTRCAMSFRQAHSPRHQMPADYLLATLAQHVQPARMPVQPSPMLCTLVVAPFDDPAWIFEPKYDGLRLLARFDGRNLTLLRSTGSNRSASRDRLRRVDAARTIAPTMLRGSAYGQNAARMPPRTADD